MMTVNEISKITGVSVRTLQYYDNIDLLKPAEYTESGYRLYDEKSIERLEQIMLFKELEFPLKAIKEIIDAPNFDKEKALRQQIELLTLKKEHLENLISFAQGLKELGGKEMDFTAFDNSKIEEFTKRAREEWGDTEAFKEFEEKTKDYSDDDSKNMMNEFMGIFEELGKVKDLEPSSEEVQILIKKLQEYITDHFYNCTNEILLGLGIMYASGSEFTENIDRAGGEGTAIFTNKAIEIYCKE